MPDISPGCAEAHHEVIAGLQEAVADNLNLLGPIDSIWQPSDFLPDMTRDDWVDQLTEFRAAAEGLSDELLIVLVGDMVTEEALPNYAISLSRFANDPDFSSVEPWAKWLRGWTAEENRHGDLLNAYLRLTGRVDMHAVEVTIHHLIANGFDARAHNDPYAGLIYTSFQERATKVSHQNVARLARKQGDSQLARICHRIAGDESRHETFYTRMMGHILDQAPGDAMLAIRKMIRGLIAMPGKLMYDGKDPDLFDHFAVVAQQTRVYTAHDYADILQHLVDTWRLSDRPVTGKAARAQDYLCRQAEIYHHTADRYESHIQNQPVAAFSWLGERQTN
jgi:acyl-[acyl-carrier-protein] desaturase